MWNPMQDMLSGRAIQLFEYNLAYSIPLYLHINENSDNENMLQFWYYASLVRHLGIGGLRNKEDRTYKALKDAMILYKELKPFFTRGRFYGIEQNIHLHVDETSNLGVLTAYNLTSRAQKVKVQIAPKKYNLNAKTIELHNGINQKLRILDLNQATKDSWKLEFEIPPLSPVIGIFKI